MHKPVQHQPYRRNLPPGLWLFFNRMPAGLSDTEFQKFLEESGIYLPIERISIQSYSDGSSAKVSVGNDVLSDIVNWMLDNKTLGGKAVTASAVTADRQGAFAQARHENHFR